MFVLGSWPENQIKKKMAVIQPIAIMIASLFHAIFIPALHWSSLICKQNLLRCDIAIKVKKA
jgi:hypothetical protein